MGENERPAENHTLPLASKRARPYPIGWTPFGPRLSILAETGRIWHPHRKIAPSAHPLGASRARAFSRSPSCQSCSSCPRGFGDPRPGAAPLGIAAPTGSAALPPPRLPRSDVPPQPFLSILFILSKRVRRLHPLSGSRHLRAPPLSPLRAS